MAHGFGSPRSSQAHAWASSTTTQTTLERSLSMVKLTVVTESQQNV